MLTDIQLQTFRDQGDLVVENLLDEQTRTAIRIAHIDQHRSSADAPDCA